MLRVHTIATSAADSKLYDLCATTPPPPPFSNPCSCVSHNFFHPNNYVRNTNRDILKYVIFAWTTHRPPVSGKSTKNVRRRPFVEIDSSTRLSPGIRSHNVHCVLTPFPVRRNVSDNTIRARHGRWFWNRAKIPYELLTSRHASFSKNFELSRLRRRGKNQNNYSGPPTTWYTLRRALRTRRFVRLVRDRTCRTAIKINLRTSDHRHHHHRNHHHHHQHHYRHQPRRHSRFYSSTVPKKNPYNASAGLGRPTSVGCAEWTASDGRADDRWTCFGFRRWGKNPFLTAAKRRRYFHGARSVVFRFHPDTGTANSRFSLWTGSFPCHERRVRRRRRRPFHMAGAWLWLRANVTRICRSAGRESILKIPRNTRGGTVSASKKRDRRTQS